MIIKILIIILTLIVIICIIIDHIITKKEYNELEYRLLKLEERLETQRLELHGRINALRYGINNDIINDIIEGRKNKNGKRKNATKTI